MANALQDQRAFNTRRTMAIWAFAAALALAFLLVGTSCALMLMGRPVPDALGALATAAGAFVFGKLPGFAAEFGAEKADG